MQLESSNPDTEMASTDNGHSHDEYQRLQRHIYGFRCGCTRCTGSSSNGKAAVSNKEQSRHELLALRAHILSCPDVPVTSNATKTVLLRLDNQIKASEENFHESASPNGGNPPFTRPNTSGKVSVAKVLIRSILLDLPLFVLFAAFAISHSLLHVYEDYLTKLMNAATWRKIDRLEDEFTYYKRECLSEDITTRNVDDLFVEQNATVDAVVDKMMVHGMSLHESVLSPETTEKLREFILRRNGELSPEEEIPLDGEEERWSFAIGANEDPIVPVALKEIASHPIIRPTLEVLVGPNPAVVEITAITAAYGCDNQGWHADVKPRGSAVKYSRTFTHSYSLFTTLQDTTAQMGATEVCPGTHYCANSLEKVCRHFGFKASGGGVWKAGDSLLLNQMAWHRGSRHVDPHAKERVVFIVTFISRPRFGMDNRQLSHGTYFHIRWDMWGHTMDDMLDPPRHMSHPLAALRSVGIWKPPKRQWGWDWMTVACLRIANGENGYTSGDFRDWIDERNVFGLPKFLWGPVSKKGGWKLFIRGTLENCTKWSGFANFVVLSGYLLLVLTISCIQHCMRANRNHGRNDRSLFRSALNRLLYTHGFVIITTCLLRHQISSSTWAQDIRSGRLLQRPFPDGGSVKVKTLVRPTTIPAAKDVLIGTRFDSRHIYSYNQFLDFHPGNKQWRNLITNAFASYRDAVPPFRDHIANSIVDAVSSGGTRFLLQNELGYWITLPPSSAAQFTKRALVKESNPVLRVIDQEIAFMLADCRYGLTRGTAMAQKYGQSYLLALQKSFFSYKIGSIMSLQTRDPIGETITNSLGLHPPLSLPTTSTGDVLKSRLFDLPPAPRTDGSHFFRMSTNAVDGPSRRVASFKIGDRVEGNYRRQGVWFEAVVHTISKDGTYGVEYTDGDLERLKPDAIRQHFGPLEEGDRAEGEWRPRKWFVGTITKVHPDHTYDILYDDGDRSYRLKVDEIRRYVNDNHK